MAGLISTGVFGATAEAAGKKNGDDGQAAICAYLLSVITYPYVSPVVKAMAVSLYVSYGCQPALP
jgi:hypothetical protein